MEAQVFHITKETKMKISNEDRLKATEIIEAAVRNKRPVTINFDDSGMHLNTTQTGSELEDGSTAVEEVKTTFLPLNVPPKGDILWVKDCASTTYWTLAISRGTINDENRLDVTTIQTNSHTNRVDIVECWRPYTPETTLEVEEE